MNPAGNLDRQAEELARALTDAAMRHPGNEAAFRDEAERELARIAKPLGVADLNRTKRVEMTLATGRADAVFNRLVVEWEPPGSMSLNDMHNHNRHAVAQVRSYVDGLAVKERRENSRLMGVACDGHVLIFARYYEGEWTVQPPEPVEPRTAKLLLQSLVSAQSGRALIADNLLHDFGQRSIRARRFATALLDQLDAQIGHEPDGLAHRLFRQWVQVFAVATGVTGEASSLDGKAVRALADLFGRDPASLDADRALFALQTYFATITKLIASLSIDLWVERADWNLPRLIKADDRELRREIQGLMRGEPFKRVGLANVVESDVFSWFVAAIGDDVLAQLREVAGTLAEYDPATLQLSPDHARDLLKDLYEGLLPKPVRHSLGQYFTPDWLAHHTLARAGFTKDRVKRTLDPACGTGTFLVVAIDLLLDRLEREGVSDRERLETVLENVVGFDIDPLAVVAARTNYVLALGDLIDEAPDGPIELPVYRADSVVTPELEELMGEGDRLTLQTSAGTFSLPLCVDTADELRKVCDLATEGLDGEWSAARFADVAAEICDADAPEKGILAEFFDRCAELHTSELNGIWTRVVRNAFMPAFIGRFDLIAGNPPWVNWESLPAAYRQRTEPLWRKSGLFVHGGMDTVLGKGKKDISMLMSYVISERLLEPGGRLAFVITETVFKSAGAGQGFRRFRWGDFGPEFRVESVDDFVDVKPFAGATNRTAVFAWRRGEPTDYPVSYTVWQRKQPRSVPQGASLADARAQTARRQWAAEPVSEGDPTSPWMTASPEVFEVLRAIRETGEPSYVAHAGVFNGGANGVYWLSVRGKSDPGGIVPVVNLHDSGKKRIQRRYGRIEAELLHPMIRGRDVRRWHASTWEHLLFVQDPMRRAGIEVERMKRDYPNALQYLEHFEGDLRARAAYKRYYAGRKKNPAEDPPYWSMFNVGQYTLSPHKVLWKDQVRDFTACVAPIADPLPLPNHKVMLVAVDSDAEAHYLAALLNSAPARALINCYSVETQISTAPARHVRLPPFDPKDPRHQELAQVSRDCHDAAKNGRTPDERSVDAAAAAVWGLSGDQVLAARTFLDELFKRDLES